MKSFILALISSTFISLVPACLEAQPEPATGTVAETMDAGGYTYIRLEDSDSWLATGTMAVAAGNQVRYSGSMEMRNFQSRALGRAFETIWFVQSVEVIGGDAGQAHPASGQGHDQQSAGIEVPAMADPPKPGEIERLASGKTIAEITAETGELNDTNVSLRAKVVKVSSNIMGKNWITLQDGSGNASEDKLIATSTETASVGDIVIAKGTLRRDVDLGSGYVYEVLLEDTTFAR